MGGTTLKVECHSGFTYAERPIAIYLNDVRVLIKSILKEWRSQVGKHFRLLLENNEEVEIVYDEKKDEWRKASE
jgi:hypothetical protein